MSSEHSQFSSPQVLGTNQTGMRAQNERLVLSLLHQRGSLSKRQVTQITALSAQTVSVIMRQLEADGLLQRGEPLRGKVGQPSVPMSLNPDGALFFGLKVGRRNAEVVLVDFLGRVRGAHSLEFAKPEPQRICDFAQQSVRALSAELSAQALQRVAGMGIAMPSRLWEWSDHLGARSEEMAAWRQVDLRAQLSALLALPVYEQNDGTAACGAELAFGVHRNLHDFLYFHIGSFVGGGVVINQCLYAGRSGNAGALGSMRIGGARQLLDEASIITLERQLLGRGLDPTPLWRANGDWREFEPQAGAWIDNAAKALARTVAAATAVIDFEAALIDGAIPVTVRARLARATTRALNALDVPGLELPPVLEGGIGAQGKSRGAASLPLFAKYLIDSNRIASTHTS